MLMLFDWFTWTRPKTVDCTLKSVLIDVDWFDDVDVKNPSNVDPTVLK